MKRWLPRISVRTKLALPVALLVIVLGFVAALVIRDSVQTSLEQELHQRSLALASELALRATRETLVDDVAGLQAIIDDVLTRDDVVYVVVISSAGLVLADSFPAGVPTDLVTIFETKRSDIYTALAFRTDGGIVRDYVAPMVGGRLGTVHLGIDQTRIRALATDEGRWVLALSVASALAVALLALAVAHLASVPIRQLAAAASRVGEGDLAARSGVDTADEVGDLARRFDEMVQRLQANQRSLEQAHEMMVRTERLAVLGQVTSGVAHEIGNPLHAARQFVEALRDRPERADRYLALIDEALQRIDKVIGQMLGYSRERRLERRPTDLNEVVLRSADFVGYDQRSHDVEIDLQLGQGLPRIDVDPDAMGQVVVNLMVNALDAVGGQGRIEVRTDVIRNGAPRPTVLLRISDDGPGISPETARHIFDPFFTTKDAGKGTGLGLSVSQELVSVQGGSIRLTSGEQGGASFEVRLPAMEDR